MILPSELRQRFTDLVVEAQLPYTLGSAVVRIADSIAAATHEEKVAHLDAAVSMLHLEAAAIYEAATKEPRNIWNALRKERVA